jgi:hypothetical protein
MNTSKDALRVVFNRVTAGDSNVGSGWRSIFKDAFNVSSAMQYARYLNSVRDKAVKNNVPPGRKTTEARRKLRSCASYFGLSR